METICASPTIMEEIRRLKNERGAVLLAHNYISPDIFHGLADITGDSLALARQASELDAELILVAGVYFMAETVKLLNPEKTVLIPDLRAGCSLAESIRPADVRSLKKKHPGVPVVTYVNTSADVKAESDICCTSGNAVEIVDSLDSEKVIFIPDAHLASHVAGRTNKELITWEGECEVHVQFSKEWLDAYKESGPDLYAVAHPECPAEVQAAADDVGSTAQMIKLLEDNPARKILLVTDGSMAENYSAAFPDKEFIRPDFFCPHMQRISLKGILDSLTHNTYRVEIPEEIVHKARAAVTAMLEAHSR